MLIPCQIDLTISQIKRDHNIPAESQAVLNGHEKYQNHEKPDFRPGDILCFWTSAGFHVRRHNVPRQGTALNAGDVPSVVLADIRCNFLPRVCLEEIKTGEFQPFNPTHWLDIMGKARHAGPIDGFDDNIEAYYASVLSDKATMTHMKKVFMTDIGTLFRLNKAQDLPDTLAAASLSSIEAWVNRMADATDPWSSKQPPDQWMDYGSGEVSTSSASHIPYQFGNNRCERDFQPNFH